MTSGARRMARVLRVISVGGVLAAIVVFMSLSALASKVEPVTVDGNPKCADINPAYTGELSVDPPQDGTFTDGTLTVTITNFDGNAATLDWSSNIGVNAVFAKGGPEGNLYTYDPPATSDTGIHPPVNPNNGTNYGWSHILFCYVATESTPSPTPSTTPTGTPTPTPSPSVTPSETPSGSPTPTTSSTPSVLPTETVHSPTPSSTTSVLGEKFGHTGADVLRWMLIGFGLLLLGIAAYVISLRGAKANR